MKKTLGGDRLGAGNKMQVELHGYERSTHDLGYLWRSTMSAGTLVPFMVEVALPGDTFDINLGCDIKTHPTIGPLFGSYKVQLDVFQCPIRLYQGQLHNNKLGIGMHMAEVKLPLIKLRADFIPVSKLEADNAQINPSCILSYLGIRGVGRIAEADADPTREFNAIPFLSYWDIYKNYYANKQEEIGAVVNADFAEITNTIDTIEINNILVPEQPAADDPHYYNTSVPIEITYVTTPPKYEEILFKVIRGNGGIENIDLNALATGIIDTTGNLITATLNVTTPGGITILSWGYITNTDPVTIQPRVSTFSLSQIDDMREKIMAWAINPAPFIVNVANLTPYSMVLNNPTNERNPMLYSQEGLGIKTYQSDLFNNWLSTEWIDGAGGISEVTAISTVGDSFTLDTLNLSKKVYDMLNRIAVSGGSYDDWLDAVYTHDRYMRAETPMYMGGLIKELVFQEVVSNSESSTETGSQPLGTLAGKGILAKKHKGGEITIKVDEPSYIMGIISLTPRIDYSQGNKWDIHLKTMDDFHKPALDEIGFQELTTEQMAWWDTEKELDGAWIQKSAGKQPAWINYMTNVNQTRGNFAIAENEMFMTLNRRYEYTSEGMQDLTTYIDPVKYNHIFAETALDAQNFWAQIAVDITARRKMSAKIMPNL